MSIDECQRVLKEIMENLMIWFLLIPMVCGLYNEHSQKNINYTLPENSLFGYSTAYIPSSQSLIVSAPNADDIGQVFSYSLDNEKIELLNITKTQGRPIIDNQGSWLGATLKSKGDFFVACAPRHQRPEKINNAYKAFLAGVCYSFEGVSLNSPQKTPEIERNERMKNTRNGTFEERMDTLGWGLDITQKGEVFVGGPVLSGRTALYRNSFNKKTRLLHYKGYNATGPSTYNFGYGVVSGNFADKIQYAVSSTYGTIGFGKIYFFDSSFKDVETIVDPEEQVSSMFGAALCAVDLGADHDHLLVGAPVYSETYNYDVGAVYLYASDSKYDKMTFIRKISGTTSGGYFGNTIITLGDLDGDGKDEVAIGAPYEDDYQGAVYIYTGVELANIDSNNVPLQKITPKDKLRYFGFSLTALQDYDGNGCNALAIGAPGSNNVVLFRSFTSVKITIEANLIQIIRENKTRVEFESCIEVAYPEKPQEIIGDINVNVAAPNGPYSIINATDGTLTYTVSLNKTLPRHCKTLTISIHKNQVYTVMYEIKAELEVDPRTLSDFNSSQVISSSQSTLSKSGQFSITDCEGKICDPVLKIKFSSSMIGGNYVIGSSDSEWFSLAVRNEGDVAYDPCIELGVSGASILQYPSTCTILNELDAKRILICSPRMALNNGSYWSIDRVLLETKDMTSSDQTMEIRYDVYNHCHNQSEKSSCSKKIILQSDTLFLLTGAALPEQNITIFTSEMFQPTTVNHLYKIKNNGSTNWVGVKSKIHLPEKLSYRIYTINDGKNTECPMDIVSSLFGFSTIICDIGKIWKTKEASVYITINISPEYLGSMSEDQPRTLITKLQLLLHNIKVSQSISTTVQLKNTSVPLWIIVTAVVVGLLILIIIAFILYECGFLRRKNKTELIKLQKSIYRQSMRRSNHSAASRSECLKQIAEEAQRLVSSTNNLINNKEPDEEQDEEQDKEQEKNKKK